MNIRHCVRLVSQNSLCLSHNELKSISIYYQPAINNDVDYRFVLGCQSPDCCKGRKHAGYADDCRGFGKRVVGGVHFRQLQSDKAPFSAEDGNPRTVKVSINIEKKRLSVY